jgi:hypothetical protein
MWLNKVYLLHTRILITLCTNPKYTEDTLYRPKYVEDLFFILFYFKKRFNIFDSDKFYIPHSK